MLSKDGIEMLAYLPAITERLMQHSLNKTRIKVHIRRRDDLLQEPIALLQLIPEEQVSLRELKRIEPVLLHEGNPEHVGASKQPAAAALALVRDGPALKGDLDVEDVLVRDLGRARRQHVAGVRASQGRDGESEITVRMQ